jgi:hypothetical protein
LAEAVFYNPLPHGGIDAVTPKDMPLGGSIKIMAPEGMVLKPPISQLEQAFPALTFSHIPPHWCNSQH